MEKKSTKIAYFVALGVFIVLLVILGVMFKDAPLPTLEVDGEMIEATTPFAGTFWSLLPPFVAISGLGENAAWDLMRGREGKTFLSVEEVAAACPKVSKTHIQMLREAGAFGDLPDTSQVSFF